MKDPIEAEKENIIERVVHVSIEQATFDFTSYNWVCIRTR